ncbi:MAG: DUF86 domain-containing protein [bacterium]
MSKRYWRLSIEDILECIEKIKKYIEEKEFDDFQTDSKTIDAVVRNLEIIGEASKNIPDDIKETFPNINWKKLVGLRNRIIHECFGVDLRIIWRIIKEELTYFGEQMKQILQKDEEQK